MIDYQEIVSLCAKMISVALPIGLIFGLSEKLINGFLSIVFGEKRVRL